MAYESHILPHAQREIKKLPSRKLQESILKTCTVDLAQDPYPKGHKPVVGQKNIFRVWSEDRNYRIIYSVHEHIGAIIVLTVRRKSETTYKQLPVKSLSEKIQELEKALESS